MPRNLRAGDEVNGYVIQEEISRGNMAFAYIARAPNGRRVFFKAFKSPSPMTPWYGPFVSYQEVMRKRIKDNRLGTFLCESLDFFEAPVPPRHTTVQYFQIFELVEAGHDLEGSLKQLSEDRNAVEWGCRVVWSKVMMGSINQMHHHNIVHSDLKPANLMLIADSGIKVGYRLKLIDIDFAVMTDVEIPWIGDMGFVGTPGYFSPEHLTGQVPEPASDVFTCGIILSELLTRTHPLDFEDDAEYLAAAQANKAKVGSLDGPMDNGNDDEVLATIQQMMHPDPARRPTAQDVLDVLNGKKSRPTSAPRRSTPRRSLPPSRVAPRPSVQAKKRHKGVVLRFGDVFDLPVAITTKINQRLVGGVGDDKRFWDSENQFELVRKEDGWYVRPNPAAPNETILQDVAIDKETRLEHGNVIGVGRAAKGILKSPATVVLE